MTKPAGYKDRACIVCGITYKPTSSQQKVCVDCAPAFRREQNRKDLEARRRAKGVPIVGETLTCADCGGNFTYSSGPQRRCAECQYRREVAAIQKSLAKDPARLKRYLETARDNYEFGGNRSKALERDGFKCCHCGTGDDLHVHHIDGRGMSLPAKERNNSLDNLQTLCRSCHSALHWKERRHQ